MKAGNKGLGIILALGLMTGGMVWAEEGGEGAPALKLMRSKSGTFVLGKRPYPAGTREKWIAEGRVLGKAPEGYFPRKKMLKGAADNRQYLPPIGNQGSEGSCVHWAGAYYVKTASMKRRDPSINITASSNQCSPRFTYNLTNAGQDNGGWGHEPFEVFVRYGGASLKQKPYVAGQVSALPTVADFIEGLHRRSTNYVWVWDWAPSATQINELKAYLDAGGVAACAVYAENTFDSWTASKGPWVGPVCTANQLNHMVTVCGYGTGYYLVANSWGTSFGSNGYIHVDSTYFEKYFGDVMYPLEGSYEASTSHVRIQIQHARRSDIRSMLISVNGSTVWNQSPLPKSLPKGGGSFTTDSRSGWQMAVDLTTAPWAANNTVTARCMDQVTGTQGSITNVAVFHDGQTYAVSGMPISIPDNTGVAGIATVTWGSGGGYLTVSPTTTNVPAGASSGRQIAVTSDGSWTAARGSNSTWITVATTSGTGDGAVSFSVSSNGTTSRTGWIVVSGGGLARTCTVVQTAAVAGSGPDLVVLSMSHTPAMPQPGQRVTFTVTIQNQGTARVPSTYFNTGFWPHRSTAPEIGMMPELNQDYSSGIPAGATRSLTFAFHAPDEGTYRAWAYVDRYQGKSEIQESNEDNNAGPMPDGYVWSVGPESVSEGWDAGYVNLGGGWRRLSWFGDYAPMGGEGWIWHAQHEFLLVRSTSTPDNIWLFATDMGWVWTSRSMYPYWYRASTGTWLWYSGTVQPRWFLNMSTGRWESWW